MGESHQTLTLLGSIALVALVFAILISKRPNETWSDFLKYWSKLAVWPLVVVAALSLKCWSKLGVWPLVIVAALWAIWHFILTPFIQQL